MILTRISRAACCNLEDDEGKRLVFNSDRETGWFGKYDTRSTSSVYKNLWHLK